VNPVILALGLEFLSRQQQGRWAQAENPDLYDLMKQTLEFGQLGCCDLSGELLGQGELLKSMWLGCPSAELVLRAQQRAARGWEQWGPRHIEFLPREGLLSRESFISNSRVNNMVSPSD
jgi:hypothetical protein